MMLKHRESERQRGKERTPIQISPNVNQLRKSKPRPRRRKIIATKVNLPWEIAPCLHSITPGEMVGSTGQSGTVLRGHDVNLFSESEGKQGLSPLADGVNPSKFLRSVP